MLAPLNRAQRVAIAMIAAGIVYLGALFITPVRRFDDLSKRFNLLHRTNDRLAAHGVPSLAGWATALVVACVVGLALTVCRPMPMLYRLRSIAIPAFAL